MSLQDILTLISVILTGAVGWASATAAYRRTTWRSQRLDAADAMIARLVELRRHLRYSEVQADGAEWLKATAAALEAIEAYSHRLPTGWRHLEQSVRIAVGEASGTVAFADRKPPGTHVQLIPHSTWVGYAEDYLTYALRTLRPWQDEWRPRRRRREELVSFDDWLRRTGRYSSGASLV